MTYAGAVGDTAAEMAATLHFTLARRRPCIRPSTPSMPPSNQRAGRARTRMATTRACWSRPPTASGARRTPSLRSSSSTPWPRLRCRRAPGGLQDRRRRRPQSHQRVGGRSRPTTRSRTSSPRALELAHPAGAGERGLPGRHLGAPVRQGRDAQTAASPPWPAQTVTTPMMNQECLVCLCATGDGWQAVELPYPTTNWPCS